MMNASPDARYRFPVTPVLRRPPPRAASRSPTESPRPGPTGRSRKTPKRPAAPPRPRIETMKVVSHPDGWALMIDDIDEPAWVLSNKRRCVESAKRAAADHGCVLRVFTRAGRKQREMDFSA